MLYYDPGRGLQEDVPAFESDSEVYSYGLYKQSINNIVKIK
jgi:hypothetical protein